MKRLTLLLMSSLLFLMVLPSQAAYSYSSVFVTSQRYDNGEMIWRSDIGTIFMLANDGQVLRFPVTEYGPLPPSPYKTAPLGKIPPMLGFGKVWGNYDDVRAKLGWAYFPEVGRHTPIGIMDDGTTYMLTQSARPIRINPNNTWQYVESIPEVPQSDPIIRFFNVSPDTAKIGDTIDISWNIENVDAVIVEVYDAYPRNDILYSLEEHHPVVGSTTFTIPEQTLHGATVTIYGVRYNIDNSARTITARLINASEVVELEDDDKPPAPVETWAVYQAYDNGMMIWRADTGMITVFFDDGTLRNYPLTYYAYLADVPDDIDVPEGKILPTNGFGRVWAYLDDVRERIGWATDTETGYDLTMTTQDDGTVAYNLPTEDTLYVNDQTWAY